MFSIVYPFNRLVSVGELGFEDLFSHSEDHSSGFKIKRTSIDQEREDRNFLTNLIIAVISALLVTLDSASLLFEILNAALPSLALNANLSAFGRALWSNFVVAICICPFLLTVFVSWIPVMNFWGMRQDLPPAQKSQRFFDFTTEDEIPRVTDLVARLDKCEESLREIGLEQAAVKELLAKLRSEGDSDTPTSE